jgi:hypothetical protein
MNINMNNPHHEWQDPAIIASRGRMEQQHDHSFQSQTNPNMNNASLHMQSPMMNRRLRVFEQVSGK